MPDPIRIHCEGSLCPGHDLREDWVIEEDMEKVLRAMCPMCGRRHRVEGDPPVVSTHQRDDVLAMIDRGDYG